MQEARIHEWMTGLPHTIGQEQTMAVAHELMRKHRIRHLPVLHGGKVVGIVTERDLHLLETLRDVDPGEVTVEDAMTPDPYTVRPDDRLADVATAMADHKYGAAVVAKEGHVVGVFTTVDACRALAATLAGMGPRHPAAPPAAVPAKAPATRTTGRTARPKTAARSRPKR